MKMKILHITKPVLSILINSIQYFIIIPLLSNLLKHQSVNNINHLSPGK